MPDRLPAHPRRERVADRHSRRCPGRGRALTRTSHQALAGSTILVVEDEFFLAEDESAALADAGATVLGPCSDAASALAILEHARPDFAVLDLNLGNGPSFDLARTVGARGITLLFATGYDPETIPAEFAAIPRLQKPVNLRALVRKIAELREAQPSSA